MAFDLKPVAAAAIFAAVVVLTAAPCGVVAQGQPPSCAQKLVGCAPYMNGTTTPGDDCCKPLKETVATELPCLCALYSSPEIFKAFNINLQDALRLAQRCGIDSTTSQCPGLSPTKAPPATPGGGRNAGHSTGTIGIGGLMSLFLFLWSVLT